MQSGNDFENSHIPMMNMKPITAKNVLAFLEGR